jgi:hypothetical protein
VFRMLSKRRVAGGDVERDLRILETGDRVVVGSVTGSRARARPPPRSGRARARASTGSRPS